MLFGEIDFTKKTRQITKKHKWHEDENIVFSFNGFKTGY